MADQRERDPGGALGSKEARKIFTENQLATGTFSGGRILNFKEGWATVLGSFGKAHYFRIGDFIDDEGDKVGVSICGKAFAHINDSAKDAFGMLYGEGNVERCKLCKRKRQEK